LENGQKYISNVNIIVIKLKIFLSGPFMVVFCV
jgi:hypothetical protein